MFRHQLSVTKLRKRVWCERRRAAELLRLLQSYNDLFDGHLGRTSLAEHVIVTGDAKPVNLPPYRTSPMEKQIIEDQVQKILQEGIIEPASGHQGHGLPLWSL